MIKTANNIFWTLENKFPEGVSSLRLETSLSFGCHDPWEHSISVLEAFQPPAGFATDPTERGWDDPSYDVLSTLGTWELRVDVDMLQKSDH